MNHGNEYSIYRNDLKYRKHRDLNADKIIWERDTKYLYENVDLDSLDYRLYECKKSGMKSLDLSNMDLLAFPTIPTEYKNNVEHLFIAENDLELIPDLTDFICLEVLEISSNNIHEVGSLPASLKEFCCRFNKMNVLPSVQECPNLVLIDCTNNEINEIPKYPKLRNLICSQNRITMIPNLENLQDLTCDCNNISYIDKCPKLKYLNCSSNKLLKLNNYDSIEELICNNNNLSDLPLYSNVRYIEIFNTNIIAVPYMPNLQELYCSKDAVKKIAKRYVNECDIDIKVHKDTIVQVIFNKKREHVQEIKN
jgi:Leucine-rich repeat (LRR) protein